MPYQGVLKDVITKVTPQPTPRSDFRLKILKYSLERIAAFKTASGTFVISGAAQCLVLPVGLWAQFLSLAGVAVKLFHVHVQVEGGGGHRRLCLSAPSLGLGLGKAQAPCPWLGRGAQVPTNGAVGIG